MTLLPDVPGPAWVRCTAPGCSRLLRASVSRARTVGPVCWAKTHPTVFRYRIPRRRAVMTAVAPRRTLPGDGQLALDLGIGIGTTTDGSA